MSLGLTSTLSTFNRVSASASCGEIPPASTITGSVFKPSFEAETKLRDHGVSAGEVAPVGVHSCAEQVGFGFAAVPANMAGAIWECPKSSTN